MSNSHSNMFQVVNVIVNLVLNHVAAVDAIDIVAKVSTQVAFVH